MVNYECFRCGYVASQRCNMKQHLNRKNICNPIEDDISIEEIKKYYGFIIKKNITGGSSFKQEKPGCEQVLTVLNEKKGTGFEQEKPGYEQEKPGYEQEKPGYEENKKKM